MSSYYGLYIEYLDSNEEVHTTTFPVQLGMSAEDELKNQFNALLEVINGGGEDIKEILSVEQDLDIV